MAVPSATHGIQVQISSHQSFYPAADFNDDDIQPLADLKAAAFPSRHLEPRPPCLDEWMVINQRPAKTAKWNRKTPGRAEAGKATTF